MNSTKWDLIKDSETNLAGHFADLRDNRNGPVFFIEHGLSKPDSRQLIDTVKQVARHRPIHSSWWSQYRLPLIVTATEVGYKYRGTGTDFWPKLESALNIYISPKARQQVRDFFCNCSNWYRGAQPADTPWTANFNLIAWPITHALIPLEFHRQLAATLANLRYSAHALDDDDLHVAVRNAAGRTSARFHTFLEDSSLSVPVIRALLGGGSSEISQHSMDRIGKDLASDSDAYRDIKIAKQIQRRLRSRSVHQTKGTSREEDTTERKTVNGVFRLRIRDSDQLVVEALFPASRDGSDADRLRRTLRRRRFAPRLWGLTPPIPSERLLSGLPFTVELRSVPDVDARLFPGLEDLGIESDLVAILDLFQLDFRLPLLFAANVEGNLARLVRGFEISAFREYWLFGKKGTLESFADLPQLNISEPFVCYRVNPVQPNVQEALRELGYSVRHGVSILIAGAPFIDERGSLPRFHVGDERIIVPRRIHAAGTRVEFGGEVVLLDDNLIRLRVPEGEQVLAISSQESLRQERFEGVSASVAITPRPVCWIELGADEMTVQALLAGDISLSVQGLAPLTGLTLTLEIEASGRRTGVSIFLDPLPHVLLSNDKPWRILLDEATRARLLQDPSPVLHARVDSLAAETWTLEQRIRPCWWQRTPAGPVLESELGPLEYGQISASSPASEPGPKELGVGSDTVLLAPMTPDESVFGPSAKFATFCRAPDRAALSLPRIERPNLRRARRGGSGSLGVEELIEAWFRWSLAEAYSLTAKIRKAQVSSILDRWLAALTCGEEWAQREEHIKSVSSDPWKMFADECQQRRLGLDDFVELTDRDEKQVVRLAEAKIRRCQPELWVRVGPLTHRYNERRRSLLDEDDYEAMDAAFEGAYQKLAGRYRRAGNTRLASNITQADPGAGPDEWDPVLETVRAKWELRELAELLYPTDTAQWLMTLDLSLMPLGDIAEELHRWATESRDALTGDVPAHQALMAILAIWIAPSTAVSLDWLGVIDMLITDRSLSRAARYLALRARITRTEVESL